MNEDNEYLQSDSKLKRELRKFNENHDELGRFSSGEGGGLAGQQAAERKGLRHQHDLEQQELKARHEALREKHPEDYKLHEQLDQEEGRMNARQANELKTQAESHARQQQGFQPDSNKGGPGEEPEQKYNTKGAKRKDSRGGLRPTGEDGKPVAFDPQKERPGERPVYEYPKDKNKPFGQELHDRIKPKTTVRKPRKFGGFDGAEEGIEGIDD